MKYLQSELNTVMSLKKLNYEVSMLISPDKSFYVIKSHNGQQKKSHSFNEARFDFDSAIYIAEKETSAHTGS